MELLDVYNKNGETTGKIVPRGTTKKELGENEYIAISQIFIENDEGKFLLEHSAKKTGYRFVPVGGHISSGETHYETIIREAKEEIGLDIKNEDFKYLGFFMLDEPIRFIYYLKKNVNISELKLQKEEVKDVSYQSPTDIFELVDLGLMHSTYNELMPKVLELRKKLK